MAYGNTRLISGGVTYYLAGGSPLQVPYAGSLTPWTVQTTTPFELALNDVTGPSYTPAPAPTMPILGGGPPFRPGRSLIAKSYDNVTESVGIQLRATSHDNACALLLLLRQVLNTALFDSPCILAVQPDGASNTTYFEILYADVPESASYIAEITPGACMFRAVITWVRSIGSAGALTTLINGVTMRNRSSSSPDDVESLGTPVGDLVYEGQPLNIEIAPLSTLIMNRLYIATVYERINTSFAESKTTTTSTAYTPADVTVTNARNRQLKCRLLARFDTFTAPSKIRLQAIVRSEAGLEVIMTSPVLALPYSAATSTLLDFGYFDVHPVRSFASSAVVLDVIFLLSSSDGTSVTARLDYAETLLYYTFATTTGSVAVSLGTSIALEGANNYNVNSVWTPSPVPRAYQITSSPAGDWSERIAYRGTLPRAFSGASLYAAWLSSGGVADNYEHNTTTQATVTATHLPLFHTLRGGA
jgi:hypothetical protein